MEVARFMLDNKIHFSQFDIKIKLETMSIELQKVHVTSGQRITDENKRVNNQFNEEILFVCLN